jgi:zinc protease
MMRPILCLVVLLLSASAAAGIAEHVIRAKVAGVDVIAYPTAVKDVVTIVGSLPAGDAFATSNVAVASLTSMMLERGTTHQTKSAIAAQLDQMGAVIHFGVDDQLVTIQARCLRKDAGRVIALIGEELRSPAFSPEEFARAQQQFVGAVQEHVDNADYRAKETFTRDIYPAGHPSRPRSLDEYLAAAKTATLEGVKAFHKRHYGPEHLTLVFVGDLDPAEVQKSVQAAFSGWTGGTDTLHPTTATMMTSPRRATVVLAGKTSVSVLLGAPTGLQARDPDALALRVGTAILGSGFTGRLMASVRDKEGLTYHIGARVDGDTLTDGFFVVDASFAPSLLEKGVTATRRELQTWWASGITAQELADRQQNLVGTYHVGLSTTAGLAEALLRMVQQGRDVNWLDEYPRAVKALTVGQVSAAIRKHLDPKNLVLVEAGTVPSS